MGSGNNTSDNDCDADGGTTTTRLTIEGLLRDVRQRRQQAMQLVALAEQSMFEHGQGRQLGEESDEEYWDAAESEGSDGSDESDGSRPPDSFLEGFTQEFVDAYKPSPAPVLLSPEIVAQLRFPDRITDAGTSPDQQSATPPRAASLHPSPLTATGRQLPSPLTTTHRQLSSPPDTANRQFSSPSDTTDRQGDPKTPNHRLRGVAIIDTQARRRLWDRVADAGRCSGDDERQIEALVRMAEGLGIGQAANAETSSRKRTPPRNPSAAAEAVQVLHSPSNQDPPSEAAPADGALLHGCSYWEPHEWHRWGDVVAGYDGQDQLAADRTEMERRLDCVHEMQADAWLHGFRDSVLPNGKLQRSYSTQPVVLQAYPDGNVKRTVLGDSETAAATTLYYANGDWSCTVPGRSCCYYYCEERVWHEQHDDGRSEEYPASPPVIPSRWENQACVILHSKR